MVVSVLTYLGGIGSAITVIVALFIGFHPLMRYIKEPKPLLLSLAVLGFSFMIHIGELCDFISVLLTGNNLPALPIGIIGFFGLPISITTGVYLGFEMFWQKYVKIAVFVFGSLGLIFYVFLFGFTDMVLTVGISPDSGLVDASVKSVLFLLLAIFLISGVFIFGYGFARLSRQVEGESKKKMQLLSLGWVLIAIGAIIDSFFINWVYILGRIIMAIGYILIYYGFSPLKNPASV